MQSARATGVPSSSPWTGNGSHSQTGRTSQEELDQETGGKLQEGMFMKPRGKWETEQLLVLTDFDRIEINLNYVATITQKDAIT